MITDHLLPTTVMFVILGRTLFRVTVSAHDNDSGSLVNTEWVLNYGHRYPLDDNIFQVKYEPDNRDEINLMPAISGGRQLTLYVGEKSNHVKQRRYGDG